MRWEVSLARRDGRFIILLALVLYFSTLFVASFFFDYAVFWEKYFGVTASKPSFLDTHHLTSSLECTRKGYDVLITNPCEPNKLPMDYPRIWLHLSKLGINQSHSIYIGVGFAILFLVSIFLIAGPLTPFEGLLYSAIICSPTIMFGVETGNTDLLMFSILAAGILLIRKNENYSLYAYFLFLCAAFLKLYPIAAFVSCFRERKQKAIVVLILALGAFGAYVYQTYPDIVQMQINATKSTYRSYGAAVLYQILVHELAVSEYIGLLTATIFGVSVFSLVAYIAARNKTIDGLRVDSLDGFRIAAAIYIVSYLFWNNWDYRQIFIIFAIPQMLLWIRSGEILSKLSRIMLGVIIVTFWINSKSPPGWDFKRKNPFWLDEFLNLFVLVYFFYALLLTLPDWLKKAMSFESNSTAEEFDTKRSYRYEVPVAKQVSNPDTLELG